MENIIGKAKSYLEEKGIDTSNMSMEEIIAKYQELLEQEEDTADDLAETVVEQDQEIADQEEDIVAEDVQDVEDATDLETILEANKDIIDSLTEEQKQLFDKIVALIK